jgi:hypothetical protein
VQTRDPETGWCYKNGGQALWGYRTERLVRGEEKKGRPIIKSIWLPDETVVAGKPVSEWARHCLLMAAEGALSGALGKLFALAEAYPDLKANANMMQLSEELTGTENKIAFARQAFNDAVMAFNTAVEQFPSNVIANFFSFKPAELLQATEAPEERKAVKVQF